MTDKLRTHIENLFANAEKTKQLVEFKEEILQNTIDRYNDLLAEGKTEEAAYNIAIAGIGDVQSIIDTLGGKTADNTYTYGYTREEIERNRKKRAGLLTAAVMLYILSVVPPISTELWDLSAQGTARAETLGVIMMFIIIAVATGLIIYRAATKLPAPKGDGTVVSDFKKWRYEKKENSAANTVCNVIWIVFTVFYVCLSLATGMWEITWLIFPIIIAVCNVVHAIADLCRK